MKNRFAVLASIVVGMLIASLDSTIMNTTMPVIVKELGGFSLYAWSFASYMIISTVTAPIYGRISDIYGRKKVFGVSIILFMLGSLLCGSSHSMIQLVIYRGIQGIGAGGILPLASIMAGDLFKVEDRGKIQALFTGMWGLSAVLAPLLGSLFVEYTSWRWIFYVNIPLGIISISLLLFYKDVYVSKKSPIDFLGALLFAISIISLLLTTVVENNKYLFTLLGVVFFAVFLFYEKKRESQLIPLSLFKTRTISELNINTLLVCLGLFGVSSFIPLFMKTTMGKTTLESGIVLLGTSVGWMLGAVPAGKTFLKLGYKKPLILASFAQLVGGAMLLIMNSHTNFWYIFLSLAIEGYGFGLGMAVSTIASQESVAGHFKGISTSLQNFSRNVGTSIGVTIMGAILSANSDMQISFHQVVWYSVFIGIISLVFTLFIKKKVNN